MGGRIPIVDYLVIDDGDPYLCAHECEACGALYFDRRNGCGRCGGRSFGNRRLSGTGVVRSFTIVSRTAKGVPGPFVSSIVDLDGGGRVKANVVNCEPTPAAVRTGMQVRLTTFGVGTDTEGTEAVCFGFEPA